MEEKTVLLIKPHLYNNFELRETVVRTVIGAVYNIGLEIVKQKEWLPSAEMVREHYASSDAELMALGIRNKDAKTAKGIVVLKTPMELARIIVGYNVKALTSGSLLAMLIKGPNAISRVRELIGPTEPAGARISAPLSLRAKFCTDSYADAESRPLNNGFHASDSKVSAAREEGIWFPNL